jgi:hypothetical protein
VEPGQNRAVLWWAGPWSSIDVLTATVNRETDIDLPGRHLGLASVRTTGTGPQPEGVARSGLELELGRPHPHRVRPRVSDRGQEQPGFPRSAPTSREGLPRPPEATAALRLLRQGPQHLRHRGPRARRDRRYRLDTSRSRGAASSSCTAAGRVEVAEVEAGPRCALKVCVGPGPRALADGRGLRPGGSLGIR